MADARDLLTSYRELLHELRRTAGPFGALLAPLQVSADLLDELLSRQVGFEAEVREAFEALQDIAELAQDAPAALRTQAKAFSAAAASFEQAAHVMNLQADLLERTRAASALTTALKPLRRRGHGGGGQTRG